MCNSSEVIFGNMQRLEVVSGSQLYFSVSSPSPISLPTTMHLAGSILGIECSPRRPIHSGIPGSRFRPAAPDEGDGGGGKEYGRNREQGLALICQRSPHLRDLARHRAQTAGAAGDAFARERMREKRARSAPRKVSCAQKPRNLAKHCLSEPCQPI